MSEPEHPATPPAPPPPPAAAPPPPQYSPYPGGYPPPPQPPYPGYAPAPAAPKNGYGIASLVTAIIGLLTLVGGIILGPVAIVLGIVGRGRAKRQEATNGGFATAGIVLGIISIIVSIVAIILAVVLFDAAFTFFDDIGGTDYLDCLSRAGSNAEAEQCAREFSEHVENEYSVTLTPTP